MRRYLGALVCLAAIGCSSDRPWESQVREPDELPPLLPEHLLRQPCDFRILDVSIQKEFFLYYYKDEQIEQEIVAVIDHSLPVSQRAQRLATQEQHDYAIAAFVEQWKSKGEEEKLRYFNRIHDEEMARNATLLDQDIRFKRAARAQRQEELEGLEADQKSRRDTGAFAEGSEKFNLMKAGALDGAITRTKYQIAVLDAQITILEHKRALRDGKYRRVSTGPQASSR